MVLNGSSLPAPPPSKTGWPWEVPEGRTDFFSASISWPRITIVTPSFNQGAYLEQTIRSVLLQRYPNLQYIVVDGGSTDNSHEIIEKYSDHISIIIEEKDDGQSDAIHKGLELANGELFNWINSDDHLSPVVLRELGQKFTRSIDAYAFRVTAIQDDQERYVMENRNLSAKSILRADRYSFSQPGVWYRTEKIADCGGIDRSLNYGFDWDLLIRYLSAHPRLAYSRTTGAYFRLHSQSKTVLELSKSDPAENHFRREALQIREKLERLLPASQADASRLGRRREPWNQWLVERLDDMTTSPMLLSLQILRRSLDDPRARISSRTFGSVVRLWSRYFRPKFYHSERFETP